MRRLPAQAVLAFALAAASLVALVPSPAQAQQWGQVANISATMGVNDGRICTGEASRGDIGCAANAPYVSRTTGYLGIGTNTPQVGLDVRAETYIGDGTHVADAKDYWLLVDGQIGIAGDNGIEIKDSGTRTWITQNGMHTNWGSVRPYTFTGTAGAQMGVNTANPSATLHVSGTLRIAAGNEACDTNRLGAIKYQSGSFYVCQNTSNGWEAMATSGVNSNNDRIISGTTQVIAYNNTSATIATAGVERVIVGTAGNVGIGQQPVAGVALSTSGTTSFNGNVGIGTSSPLAPLHISSSNASGMGLRLAMAGDSTQDAYRNFMASYDNSNNLVWFVGDANPSVKSLQLSARGLNNDYSLDFLTGTSALRMRITPDGQVGINNGFTQPSTTLDITGAIRVGTETSTTLQTCDANRLGAIKYQAGSFYVCQSAVNGWEAMATSGVNSNNDRIISGTTQMIAYNNTSATIATAGVERVIIGTSGNVGIAQQPVTGRALSVSGSTTIRGKLDLAEMDPSGTLSRVFVGNNAGSSNTGKFVTGIGYFAASTNTGNDVIAIGQYAASSNTGSSNITAMGASAASYNAGSSILAIGASAARDNTGNSVRALGDSAARQNTGVNVTAIGSYAAEQNTGGDLIAIGTMAARYNTASETVAIGEYSLFRNRTQGSVGIGSYSLNLNDDGIANTGVGYYSLASNGDGSYNTAFGYRSGYLGYRTTGTEFSANTLLGSYTGTALTTGSSNTIVGANSGMTLTTGSNNILIGAGITPFAVTGSGQLSIGNAIFGNIGPGAALTNKIGINVVSPTQSLEVSGTVSATRFVGDGSGLTNLTVQGDRITSGTSNVTVNSATGVISFTTNGTNTSYIHGSLGYVGPGVSATGTVSAGTVNTGFVVLRGTSGSAGISLTAAGDNLGDHIATQNLAMGGFNITGAGTVSATAFVGDGSGLTGLNIQADRITSGTTQMITYNNTSATIATAGVERIIVGTNGNVGIGTTAPSASLHVMNQAILEAAGGSSAGFSIRRARGTTSAPTAVNSGDTLGVIGAMGYGATAYPAGTTGAIQFVAENTFTDTSYGTGISFQTTDKGSTTRVQRMRISAEGLVGIGTSPASTTLQVAGSIRMAAEPSTTLQTCDANRTGAIKFESGEFQVCRNGSAWENLATGNLSADRITSGTSNVTVNSATGVISFTTGGTNTSYIHGSLGYVGPGVSATGTVSAGTVNTGAVILRATTGSAGISLTAPGDNLGNHTATQNLAMGGFNITGAGTISATTYYGDGSNLTGLNIQSDRITSGTTRVTTNSATATISFTTAGTVTSYLHSTVGLVTPAVSTTTGDVMALGFHGSLAGQSNVTPTYSWVGEENTGMYRSMVRSIGFSTSGTLAMSLMSNANTVLGPLVIPAPTPRLTVYTGQLVSATTGVLSATTIMGTSPLGDYLHTTLRRTAIGNTSATVAYRIQRQADATVNAGYIQFGSNAAGGDLISFGNNDTELVRIRPDGTISATAFVGDGSGLTNLNVSGDRITSGSTVVTANSATSTISFTTAGTVTSYLHGSLGLVTPGVSATGTVSAATVNTALLSLRSTTGSAGVSLTVTGDNLGNHTATQSLNMGGFNISNVGTISATTFYGDGSNLTGLNIQSDRITSGTTSVRTYTNTSATITTAGIERMVVGTNGTVGIGQQPFATSTLNVSGTGTIIRLTGNGDSTSDAYTNTIGSYDSDGNLMWNLGDSTTLNKRILLTARGPLGYYYPLEFEVGAATRMRIDTNGNVGISTTSPNAKLEVNGRTSTTTIQLSNSPADACTSADYGTMKMVNGRPYVCRP